MPTAPPGDWREGRTVINVDEDKMQRSFEKLMDQVYLLYHTHPTNLPHIPLSDYEIAEMAYYQTMAKVEGENFSNELKQRLGSALKKKKVYLQTDARRSNGILRKEFAPVVVEKRSNGTAVFVVLFLLFILFIWFLAI